MTFDNLTTTSCEVKNDDGASQKYCVPPRISTWQVIEFSTILGDFLDASSEAGSALVNAIIAIVQTGDVKLAAQSVRDYDAASGTPGFGFMVTKGLRDILRYTSKADTLPRLMAVLFLKPGELAVENIEERIAIFRQAPIVLLGGAVKDFLGKKMESLKNTPSGSAILETMKSFQSRVKQTNSSPIITQTQSEESVGTADSLTSLPTETSPENTE